MSTKINYKRDKDGNNTPCPYMVADLQGIKKVGSFNCIMCDYYIGTNVNVDKDGNITSGTVICKCVPGICRECGCTETNPCYNPDHGYCWWADDTETLCSHCLDESICDDPNTQHCINDKNGK